MALPTGKNGGRRLKPGELTPLQSAFVDEYLKDLDVSAAARRAGSSPSTGHNMIRTAHIKAEIQRRKQLRAERNGIDSDRVLVELARIGFSDIADVLDWKTVKRKVRSNRTGETRTVEETVLTLRDLKTLSPAARAAIAEVKTTKRGLQVKFHNKQAALDSLAKHLGLYQDTVELRVPVQFIIERSGDAAQPAIEGEVIARG